MISQELFEYNGSVSKAMGIHYDYKSTRVCEADGKAS